jgi:eukaryotic-like serine/threonine-protein kinase
VPKKIDNWFDRYKFCQPLGQGGMGVVYLAEDLTNGNGQCVIKQLSNQNSSKTEQTEAVRFFQREAEILRALDHPGIVRVFDDHATEDGQYFLVMDYVPGKNLDDIVAAYGPFNSEATVEIAIQCCEVLEYLHELDPPILYRDLKPSNLMLTPDGKIVFIDFGIARSFMPKEAATRVVTTGYSPPEQYFGRPELKSDLYAMGATLGFLLTQVRPKPLAESVPKKFAPSVLSSLDNLVRRLTAHGPESRPESARTVRHELYRIYKEIHPDFEIPQDEVVPAAVTARKQKTSGRNAPTDSRMRQSITTQKLEALAAAKEPKKNGKQTAAQQKGKASRLRQQKTFWTRLKDWIIPGKG